MFLSKYPSLALLLTTYLLTGCNEISNDTDISSPIEEDISPLTSFNFTEIIAGTTNIKQMTLNWDAASSETGVTYSVCEKDTTQTNDCLGLTSVTDQYTATVTLDSLVDVLSKDYFILASMGNVVEASNEMSLSTETITKMIGYFKASNTEEYDKFGYSLALSGDGETLAVGAILEDSDSTGVNSEQNNNASKAGAVYLFKKLDDSWSQMAYLKASNTEKFDEFGYSLALNSDGSTLAVGAIYEDNSGAVYLFESDGSNWQQSAYLKASNMGESDHFGDKVALSGDGLTLAVSAPKEDSNGTGVNSTSTGAMTDSGAVYLFNSNNNGWTQSAYVKASNTGPSDNFGESIALSSDGTTLAVGAYYEDSDSKGVNSTPNESAANSGAVYLFTINGSLWEQSAYVKASNTGKDDNFGISVALSADGNTLAVGAMNEDNEASGVISDGSETTYTGSASASGAVYLFNKGENEDDWIQSAYVKASNTGANDWFGFSVALSEDGNTLAVGADGEDSGSTGIDSTPNDSTANAGAVYLFNKGENGWIQGSYVKASNTGQLDLFGYQVAISADGKTLVVGAYQEDNIVKGVVTDGSESSDTGTASDSGAVYLY